MEIKLKNKELMNHEQFKRFVNEAQRKRLENNKGLTTKQIDAIANNINQFYHCSWDGTEKVWIIDDEEHDFVAKKDGRGKNSPIKLELTKLSIELLCDYLRAVQPFCANEKENYYTLLGLFGGFGSRILYDCGTTSDFIKIIKKVLKQNRQYFNSFNEFTYADKVCSEKYIDLAFDSYVEQLADYFVKICRGRCKEIFEHLLKKHDVFYKNHYLANVAEIKPDEVDYEHFTKDLVYIDPETYQKYKDYEREKKALKWPDKNIKKNIVKRFKFNYAFEVYQFADNSHLPACENVAEKKAKVRDLLFDRLCQLACKANNKEESYKDLALTESVNELFSRLLKENATFKLKRHREYLKASKLIFGELIRPSNSKLITQDELEAVSEGTPEDFKNARTISVVKEEHSGDSFIDLIDGMIEKELQKDEADPEEEVVHLIDEDYKPIPTTDNFDHYWLNEPEEDGLAEYRAMRKEREAEEAKNKKAERLKRLRGIS